MIAARIASYLAGEGVATLGGSASWALFYAAEPPEPDDAITVYDTPGRDTLSIDDNLRRPSFQVRARSKDYDAALAKQQDIRDLLAVPTEIDLDGSRMVGAALRGDINAIGRDESDRHLLVATYDTIIHQVEAMT